MDELWKENTLRSLKIQNLHSRGKEHRVISLERPLIFPSPLADEYRKMEQKAQVLRKTARDCNRRKDLLHLLLSYPMKPEADQADFFRLRDIFVKLNGAIRSLDGTIRENAPPNTNLVELTCKDIFVVLEDVKDCLAKYDFDINPYNVSLRGPGRSRPAQGWSRWISIGPTEEWNKLAIDSAIDQCLHCIMGGQLKVIGISGIPSCDVWKVTKALEDLQVIRSKFEVVISVSVSERQSISEVRTGIAKELRRLVGTDISLPLDEALKPYQFLLILHCSSFLTTDMHDLKIPDHGSVVLIALAMDTYQVMPVDLEIRMKDHLLPLMLFWENVHYFGSSHTEQMALQLIESCHSHLLAIILLARALKHKDVGVWELALQELMSSSKLSSPVEGMSEVMVRVLKFIWQRKNCVLRHCIKHSATSATKDKEVKISSLVACWIKNGFIETEKEGNRVLQDLINSFFLEKVSNDCVRMREETRDVLLSQFIPQLLHPLYLNLEGLGLSEAPEVAEWDAKEINLNNNKLSKLPGCPNCPVLVKLFLQNNNNLMEIPPSFFECMPKLRVFDLSRTSIKSLPPSISRLVSLQEFLLRGCELFMDLPPEIGALSNLQVFDLEGTEILSLPCEIGKLSKLECFKVSFYGYGNSSEVSKQKNKRIPKGLLSGLCPLKELSIDVNPDDEEWVADVEDFIYDLQELRGLLSLKMYLPEVGLLKETKYLPSFKFTVGRHKHQIISCLPHAVEEEFKNQENYLEYINGEYIPSEIQNALKYTNAFILKRHWAVQKLSEFGTENMVELKFCLLVECNELQTIIDGGEFCIGGDHKCELDVDKKPVLESLEYLGIHCMMNLRSICEGPIGKGSLSKLKFLALHDCPNLSTIFKLSWLGNLYNLEELIVEDCLKIHSLVSQESSCFESNQFLPSLKKMSLLDLPELVSISSGLCIAPKLERIIIYACPRLEILSPVELSSNDLKVIKGEIEWWDSLRWHESNWSSMEQDYMVSIFVELKRDATLMDQLAESTGNSL